VRFPPDLDRHARITCVPRLGFQRQRSVGTSLLRDVPALLDTPARSAAAVSDRTALSPLAKDRTKNTSQTATKPAPGRRASGSSTAKATKYRSQDPA
jgi:hypothetical protein